MFGDLKTLTPTAPWSVDAEAALLAGDIDALELNYALGFTGDLDFLAGLHVKHLTILDRSLTDLDPVANLAPGLLSLSLQTAPEAIFDLTWTPDLVSLSGDWQQIEGWSSGADLLRDLYLAAYDGTTLEPLAYAADLQALRLAQPRHLVDLDGIEQFGQLSSLEVTTSRHLTDLSAIAELGDRLTRLWLESCTRLDAMDAVGALNRLTDLGIADCGNINSIGPLSELMQLERLAAWGTTRIVDGDLSPLIGKPVLSDLRLKSRRDYSPSLAELRATLPAYRP